MIYKIPSVYLHSSQFFNLIYQKTDERYPSVLISAGALYYGNNTRIKAITLQEREGRFWYRLHLNDHIDTSSYPYGQVPGKYMDLPVFKERSEAYEYLRSKFTFRIIDIDYR